MTFLGRLVDLAHYVGSLMMYPIVKVFLSDDKRKKD